MSVFIYYAGIVLGLIFSTTMISGAVWCVQITLKRGLSRGLSAGLAISFAQIAWAAFAGIIILWLATYRDDFDWLFRMLAIMVLIYMAITVFGAERIKSIDYDGPLKESGQVFMSTFGIALTMPMRLPGYVALFLSVNVHHFRHLDLFNSWMLAVGIGVGSMLWWTYFCLLAALFGKRVPEPITIKSMNKLRVLAGAVFIGLTLICITPLLPGF